MNHPVSDGMRLHYTARVAVDLCTATAAVLITSSTCLGWESMGTWLLFTSTVLASMRFAAKRSKSGWTVRSSVATIDQLGFDLQAMPSCFWVNRSRAGAKCVA